MPGMDSWNDLVSAVAAVASAAAALFALKVAIGARNATVDQAATSKDVATTSREVAATSRDAAAAAVSSAAAAVASAEVAATLARMELDRRHDEMAPRLQTDVFWRRNGRTKKLDLFIELTNVSGRDYRIGVVKVLRENATQGAHSGEFAVDQRVEIWLSDDMKVVPVGVRVDFDAVDPCPCPRTVADGRHWQRRITVKVPPQDKQRDPIS